MHNVKRYLCIKESVFEIKYWKFHGNIFCTLEITGFSLGVQNFKFSEMHFPVLFSKVVYFKSMGTPTKDISMKRFKYY